MLALWNNAAFLELLGDLGVAQADLVQAGMLPNPELAFFSEMPGKPFKYVIDMPLETFWLRPYRLRIAEADAARAAERLTQAALNLIRDARQAHLNLILARSRHAVLKESLLMRQKIASLVQTRLRLGDITPQEASVAAIDVLLAEQEIAKAELEDEVAELHLRQMMGVGESADRTPLKALPTTTPLRADWVAADLITEGQKRPDALAVEHAISAAQERVRFAKLAWVRVLGIVDASSGDTGHVAGPAVRLTLPIFNWNEGGVARAEADLEKLIRQRATVRDQISLEVREALVRYRRIHAEIEMLHTKIRPQVDAAIGRAQSAYGEGGTSYLEVLQTTRQLFDSRLREEQLQVDFRRAWIELERSVGKRLDNSPPAIKPATSDAPAATRRSDP